MIRVGRLSRWAAIPVYPKRLRHPVYIARADAISDFPTLAPTDSDDARTLRASLDHEDRDPSAGLTCCIPCTRGVECRQHPGPCPPSFARHVPAGALRCRDRGPGLRLRLLCREHLRLGAAGDQADLAHHRRASRLHRLDLPARLHDRHDRFRLAADRWGRKATLGASILLYGITTALAGLTTNVAAFTGLRFLTGVGGAGELAVGAPYTAEVWPAKTRAIGVGGVIFSLFSLGYVLAAGVALVLVPRFGWQSAFLVAIVPAVILFLVRRGITESHRYTAVQATTTTQAASCGTCPGAPTFGRRLARSTPPTPSATGA